jgi:hypothetical protein
MKTHKTPKVYSKQSIKHFMTDFFFQEGCNSSRKYSQIDIVGCWVNENNQGCRYNINIDGIRHFGIPRWQQ